MGWTDKQRKWEDGKMQNKGLEKYLSVVRDRKGWAWYESEVHPSVVSGILGRRVNGRSYSLGVWDYDEWLTETKMDMMYGYVPWRWGRKEMVDDWGRNVYVGPDADLGDLVSPPPYTVLNNRLDELCKIKNNRGIEWALYTAPMIVMDALGLEKFCFAISDDWGKLKSWIQRIDERVRRQLDIILEYPVDVVQLTEVFCDKNGPMFPPNIIEGLLSSLSWHAGTIHDENRLVSLHCDGDNEKLYDEYVRFGVDVFNGYEGKCQGADIHKWGGHLSFRGCIDSWTLEQGTPDEIKRKVEEKKKTLGPHIIASTHDTGDVPLDNFKAMMEAALDNS